MDQFLAKFWRIACLSGLAVLWILSVLYPNFSRAYSSNDMGDGVLELSTPNDQGFVVTQAARKTISSDGKRWVYFCITENDRLPNNRCFYGRDREFRDVKEGMKLLTLQYELKDRLYNNKNEIPVGKGRYFYSVKIVRPAA